MVPALLAAMTILPFSLESVNVSASPSAGTSRNSNWRAYPGMSRATSAEAFHSASVRLSVFCVQETVMRTSMTLKMAENRGTGKILFITWHVKNIQRYPKMASFAIDLTYV